MKTLSGRVRWAAPISLLALVAACATDVPAEAGEGAVAVTASALSAADVVRVTVTVTAADMHKPVVADLVKVGGKWQGVIGKIPAGTGRRFHGEAYGAANAVVYTGDLEDVTIQKNATAAISVLLQQSAAPVPFQNAAPVIDGMVASTNAPGAGEPVTLTLAAHDVDPGDALTYDWSATGGTLTKAPSGTSATWLAPAAVGDYVITANVTDSKGSIAAISFTTKVDAGKGNASVAASFNTWPLVSRILATSTRLDVNQATGLGVDASDVDGDPLTYQWSSSCVGAFGALGLRNTSFRLLALPASGTCDLEVSVADGRGGVNRGTLTIATGPGPAVAYLPEVDSTFQSSPTSDGGDTITFRIGAHDPQAGAVGISWSASTGTLGVPATTATDSEVVWSAPSCLAASATVTATVTSATGTTQHAFTVTPTANAACCVPQPAGLVSWWRGESNDPGDHKGVNSTGLGGGLVYGPGKVGQAFTFVDPSVHVEATTIGFPTGGGARTIEQWVRIDADNAPNVEYFFSGYGTYATGTGEGYALGAVPPGWMEPHRSLFFSPYGSAIFGPTLATATWYHVAVTTVANGNSTLYLDGVALGTSPLFVATPANSTFFIGRQSASRSLIGAVDEISVYDRALSASEVAAIYGAGSKGKCQ